MSHIFIRSCLYQKTEQLYLGLWKVNAAAPEEKSVRIVRTFCDALLVGYSNHTVALFDINSRHENLFVSSAHVLDLGKSFQAMQKGRYPFLL